METHPTCRQRQLVAPLTSARQQRPDRRASPFSRQLICILAVTLSSISGAPAATEEVSKQQMQSLDEQVQEIKADVLSIAAELRRLEEKLLYPSNTQVAVFVSLTDSKTLQLDSVQIHIDGKPVAHHLYSFKEVEALQKGGVQRIYTGNIPTGEHQLDVSVSGKLPSGRDFGGTESFKFSKDVEPKLIGITVAGRDSGTASIETGGW